MVLISRRKSRSFPSFHSSCGVTLVIGAWSAERKIEGQFGTLFRRLTENRLRFSLGEVLRDVREALGSAAEQRLDVHVTAPYEKGGGVIAVDEYLQFGSQKRERLVTHS